jgi:hypothetical protein
MSKFFVVLMFTGISYAMAEDSALNDLSVGNALGGPEILEIVKSAGTVTAQRIDSELADTKELAEEHPKIIDLGKPFDVPAAEAEALKAVFTESATYLSPSKTCTFRANVRYGFVAGPDRKAEMVLCFGCGELEVWHKGRMVAFGPFDGGYGKLLAITKQLFPKDEFLAAFTEEVFKERAGRMQSAAPGDAGPAK